MKLPDDAFGQDRLFPDQAPAGNAEEVCGQQQDVLLPFAQRKARDRKDLQVKVQVAAYAVSAPRQRLGQQCRRDDADVERPLARIAPVVCPLKKGPP